MKYMCLVYLDSAHPDALAARDSEAATEELIDFREQLRASGYYVSSGALQQAQTAATIRVQNGELLIDDGPAILPSGHLTGFYVIDARDLNDAIRVASRIPPARIGSVEVRPLRELKNTNGSLSAWSA